MLPSTRLTHFRKLVHRARGMSAVELAVTVGLILALLSIAIPIYLNGRNESFDTKARENVEHLVNQAESRLIRDRGDSFLLYGNPDALVDVLVKEDPSLEGRIVPLKGAKDGGDGEGDGSGGDGEGTP